MSESAEREQSVTSEYACGHSHASQYLELPPSMREIFTYVSALQALNQLSNSEPIAPYMISSIANPARHVLSEPSLLEHQTTASPKTTPLIPIPLRLAPPPHVILQRLRGLKEDPTDMKRTTELNATNSSTLSPKSGNINKDTKGPNKLIKKTEKRERARKHPKRIMTGRTCMHCGATSTPEWRTGPDGKGTLCNACGLRYRKFLRSSPKEVLDMAMTPKRRPTSRQPNESPERPSHSDRAESSDTEYHELEIAESEEESIEFFQRWNRHPNISTDTTTTTNDDSINTPNVNTSSPITDRSKCLQIAHLLSSPIVT